MSTALNVPTTGRPARSSLLDNVSRFLEVLWQRGDMREVRIPKHNQWGHTASGYFDSPERLVRAISQWDGKANIYVTLNPVDPALLARAVNRIQSKAENTTSDADIVCRRFLFIDVDSVRPSGISATQKELAAAQDLLEAVTRYLSGLGWPEPVVCMSGNGYYAIYAIELPNTAEATQLLGQVLKALATKCDTPNAKIDTTVGNASRIIGLVGTKKVKGDETEDRPHRRSEIISVPEKLDPVPVRLLKQLAGSLSSTQLGNPPHRSHQCSGPATPLGELLDDAGLDYREQPPDANAVTWYHLRRCPFHSDGRDYECGVGQKLPYGPYAGHCFHPEGNGKGWQDFKQALGLRQRSRPSVASDAHHQAIVAQGQTSEAASTPLPSFPQTDSGNGELFAHLHGDVVRYDHRRHRYLLFNQGRWQEDAQAKIRIVAKETARHRLHLAAEMADDTQRATERRFAKQSENKTRQEAMLSLAQSEEPISDDGEHWDEKPMLLGVTNGVLELDTGVLRPGRPEDRMTLFTPIFYDPTATCPRFEQFLAEIFEGNTSLIEFIRRAIGYSLTGYTYEQAFFFCFGSGANGKGMLFTVLRQLLGSYAQNLPFQSLELQSRGGIPNDIASIVDRRLVTVAETNRGVRLNEALIKTLTGEDVMTARFLRQEFFNFIPRAKFWLAANHKPDVKDLSDGFWRRILVVTFARQFAKEERDPHLAAKLTLELPGILAWAVGGCGEWQERGLDAPPEVTAAGEEYRLESDTLGRFISERCAVGPEERALGNALFAAYRFWAAGEGMTDDSVLGSNEFGREVKMRFRSKHTNEGRRYFGIGVRP